MKFFVCARCMEITVELQDFFSHIINNVNIDVDVVFVL